jgi:hypothetical protein
MIANQKPFFRTRYAAKARVSPSASRDALRRKIVCFLQLTMREKVLSIEKYGGVRFSSLF